LSSSTRFSVGPFPLGCVQPPPPQLTSVSSHVGPTFPLGPNLALTHPSCHLLLTRSLYPQIVGLPISTSVRGRRVFPRSVYFSTSSYEPTTLFFPLPDSPYDFSSHLFPVFRPVSENWRSDFSVILVHSRAFEIRVPLYLFDHEIIPAPSLAQTNF